MKLEEPKDLKEKEKKLERSKRKGIEEMGRKEQSERNGAKTKQQTHKERINKVSKNEI